MNTRSSLMAVAAAALLAAGALVWYLQRAATPSPPAEVTPAARAPVAPAASAASEAHYPLPAEAALPPLRSDEVAGAVGELLGGGDGAALVFTDDFVHRLAATVDNLGRDYAPAMLWPVRPTGGRFTVEQADGRTVIAGANSARYAPFVHLVEQVDAAAAVKLYWRMEPLLQAAYRELGFPKGFFNDRLVHVIDLLLVTPQPSHPIQVQLVDVKGPVPSTRPWVRYEFVDANLQSLAAGQKILLRVGPENERRLKAKLRAVRALLTATS